MVGGDEPGLASASSPLSRAKGYGDSRSRTSPTRPSEAVESRRSCKLSEAEEERKEGLVKEVVEVELVEKELRVRSLRS